MTKLHENVKLLCKEHKISIRKLENELSFKPNTISSWAQALPSSHKVLAVANRFDVSVDFLLGNSDNRLSHKKQLHEGSLMLMAEAERLEISTDLASTIIKLMKVLKEDVHL